MDGRNSQSAFALIKFFSKKEYYLSFLAGTSVFGTPHFYRTCEDIGRGDRNESCVLFWDRKLGGVKPKFIRPDGIEMAEDGLESILVHPLNEQHDAWMQSWAIIGPHNDFEGSLERMQKEFGSFFVMLPANRIEEYAHLVEKVSGLKVSFGAVNYSDDPAERSLTVKDASFSYQKEFRFFAGTCSKGELEGKFFELPELRDLLLNCQTLKLVSPNGVVKYCSVGHGHTVTA